MQRKQKKKADQKSEPAATSSDKGPKQLADVAKEPGKTQSKAAPPVISTAEHGLTVGEIIKWTVITVILVAIWWAVFGPYFIALGNYLIYGRT